MTNPAAVTMSIGLLADALLSWFLLTHLDSLIMTRQLSSTYRDLVPSRQIIVTRDFSTVYRDLQKPRHRDADGNSPNRRAVRLSNNLPVLLITWISFCILTTGNSYKDITETRLIFSLFHWTNQLTLKMKSG